MEINRLQKYGVDVLEQNENNIIIKTFLISQGVDHIASVLFEEDADRIINRLKDLDVENICGDISYQIEHTSFVIDTRDKYNNILEYLEMRFPDA